MSIKENELKIAFSRNCQQKHTSGGIILQIPYISALGRILLIYSSGPMANSSRVGRKTGHPGGGVNSNS